ncbi:MAG: TolC family protein [Colwellia sp.]|nr:TolC family protein [Colwellia sp.]
MPTRKIINTKPITDRFLIIKKLIIATLSAVSLTTLAQQPFTQQSITLYSAISYTLQQHPELKSFSHMQDAAMGLIEQAAIASPIIINAGVEDVLGTGSYSGVAGMQTTLSISWLLEGDIIESRVNAANQKATVSMFEKEVKALDVAAQTAKIFITLLSQQEQLVLAKLARNHAKRLLREIESRVAVGKVNIIDELRAKADLSKKELTVEDFHHEIGASKAQLAAQWQGDTDFTINGTLIGIPSIAQVEAAVEKLKSNPRLKIFASQQRIAESEIELAKANQNPAWSINTGIKRNEAVDDFSFIAGISIPFGGENSNRGRITAWQAKKNQSIAESDAWFKRISIQLLLLTHKLQHNLHVIAGLSSETIPLLEQASVKAAEAYSLGNYRYTDLYAVQQELVATQIELIQAYTNIQLFNIELERLTGSSISM